MSLHLLSSSTRPFSCASHLAQLAIHNSSSPCLKFTKYRCSRYFQPFWQFSEDPLSQHHYHLGVSAFPWPNSRRQYFAFACLPSRPNGLLLLWLTTSFAAATAFLGTCWGTAGLLPVLLDTQYHATRFAHSLALHHFSLTFQPSSSACHKVVRLL